MSDSPQLAQQAYKKSLKAGQQKRSVRNAALSPSNVQSLLENNPAAKARWRKSQKSVKKLGSDQLKYKQSGDRHLMRGASQRAAKTAGEAYNKTLGNTAKGGLKWVLKGLSGPIGSAIAAAEMMLSSSKANEGEKEYLKSSDVATYYMNYGSFPQGAFQHKDVNPGMVIEMIREWAGHDAFANSQGLPSDNVARNEQSMWGQAQKNMRENMERKSDQYYKPRNPTPPKQENRNK
tara:strand:+ start:5198 stop:5899 length:702 start_codon:yes stop_codon:yes gene_type:complete